MMIKANTQQEESISKVKLVGRIIGPSNSFPISRIDDGY